MRLDSVRNLKATLKQRVFEEMALSPQEVSGFGLPARNIDDVDRTLPTLSLGVAPAGPGDFKVAVRVQRRGMEASPHVELVRRESRGEVDVRYIGRVTKRATPWQQSRQRPLLMGVSIGHFRITAGTLGCFVTLKGGDGTPRILSNNHVLANENRGRAGDDILQPGKFDGGRKRADTIGFLDKFITLKKTGANIVDCALSTVKPGIEFDDGTLKGAGALTGLKSDWTGVDLVQKVGRTTELTQGRVTAFELDNLIVSYDIGNLRFDDQLEIEGTGAGPFSQGGDSGSLIFTSGDFLGLGLLFAGSDQGGSNGAGLTFGNSLVSVLNALNAQLLP
jgi:hypothetical protein